MMPIRDRIEIRIGNIVEQPDLAAIVNAANAQLRSGGGVAGAIHGKDDPELEQETAPLAPIKPGEAVITAAPNLPNHYVIHCLGPRYGIDHPSDKLLADCHRNALKLADEKQLPSLGFPAISTGAFGYPPEDAATVALTACAEVLKSQKYPSKLYFVLFDESTKGIYERALAAVDNQPDQ